ncbi:hypothetical protein TWF694_007296 [Orbilia ellipsospora]|uniref:Uncharacterized protein n=1 Tax=Orbilia ellipsospora TaxID=2528407 RepID=A0AAV9XHE8_9PEZI
MKISTLFAAAAIALDGVSGFALPDLEVRKNNLICKPIVVNVTRRTIKTIINREIRTLCAPAPPKPYGRPQTTSELVTTGSFGTCHYFVAKSGSHIISTVSAWCVDNPVIFTSSAPPTSITITVPTSTDPTTGPSPTSTDTTCTSTTTAANSQITDAPGPSAASADAVSTVVITSMDPKNNGYCDYWVAMSGASTLSTVSAICVGGSDPVTPTTITSTTSKAGYGQCTYWILEANGTPYSTVSAACSGETPQVG